MTKRINFSFWFCIRGRPSLGSSQAFLDLLSRSLYGRHVFTTFLGPVLGVMIKQVCLHSRRSEAHRGLPAARPWMQNALWRSLYAAMLLVSFWTSFPGPWWSSFWLQEIHRLSNVPAWAASNIKLHQHKTNFKRYTKKALVTRSNWEKVNVKRDPPKIGCTLWERGSGVGMTGVLYSRDARLSLGTEPFLLHFASHIKQSTALL